MVQYRYLLLPSCLLCLLKEPRSSDTLIVTNITSTQILVSNTLFSNKRNQCSPEKWLILGQKDRSKKTSEANLKESSQWASLEQCKQQNKSNLLDLLDPCNPIYWITTQSIKYIYISPCLYK